MLKREGYTRRMERTLHAWQERFQARRAVAANDVAVSAETREQLEAAKVGGDAAFAKLTELRAAAARYGELRDELDALWKAIDDTPHDGAAAAPADAQAADAAMRPRRARNV
jgi:hypothetical protein